MKKSPREIFEEFRASMLSKNDSWMDMLSERVELIGPLAQIEGRAGFIEVNKPFFSSITDSEILQIQETGDYIITQITTDVKTPSDKIITLEVCEWYKIQSGKIQSLKVYFDTDEFRRAIMG